MSTYVLLGEGFTVMFIGITTVCIFLSLLVLSMKFMSHVVSKLNVLYPEPVESQNTQPLSANKSAELETEYIAVALATIAAQR